MADSIDCPGCGEGRIYLDGAGGACERCGYDLDDQVYCLRCGEPAGLVDEANAEIAARHRCPMKNSQPRELADQGDAG
jgi:hypothetical protein